MATAIYVDFPKPELQPAALRGPDLSKVPALDQQLRWLDSLKQHAFDYHAVWLAQLAAIGSSAHYYAGPDGEPRIFVSYPRDDQWSERRARIDALCAHMVQSGLRDRIAELLA